MVNGFCAPAFAQEPFFATANDDRPGLGYVLLQNAIRRHGVEAVGSAPYVEPSINHAKRNIELIFDIAFDAGIHVDFHLDYNLEPTAEPLDPSFFDFDNGDPLGKEQLKGAWDIHGGPGAKGRPDERLTVLDGRTVLIYEEVTKPRPPVAQ